jgi:HAD superfamily hydrolase (TIGR01549 family)
VKSPLTAIIFDCDGVLFDSNSLKTAAFREILAAYPQEVVNQFITYHQTHGGISRYVKLRAFFTDCLQTPVDEEKLGHLLQEFGNSCQRLYQQAALTPGCLKVLETLSSQIPLFVASGSDEAELRQVFAKRGLDKFFHVIYGSPKTKQDCVTEILLNVGSNTGIFYVGDAESDWKAAKEAEITFIFMSAFSEAAHKMQERAKTEKFHVIKTLDELLPLLNSLSVV